MLRKQWLRLLDTVVPKSTLRYRKCKSKRKHQDDHLQMQSSVIEGQHDVRKRLRLDGDSQSLDIAQCSSDSIVEIIEASVDIHNDLYPVLPRITTTPNDLDLVNAQCSDDSITEIIEESVRISYDFHQTPNGPSQSSSEQIGDDVIPGIEYPPTHDHDDAHIPNVDEPNDIQNDSVEDAPKDHEQHLFCHMENQDEADAVTTEQAELVLMAYILRHNVSGVGLEDLLTVFEILAPNLKISKSKFLFLKKFNVSSVIPNNNYICNECGVYLGNIDKTMKCPNCTRLCKATDLHRSGSYFITVPLKAQLENLFKTLPLPSLTCDHPYHTIYDSCCGKMTKLLKGDAENCLTLTWNTDGVPLFHSSKKAIWPIFCSVNELEFKDRTKHMLLCGLWFNEKKPDMNVFLKPFVTELGVLGDVGFQYTDENGFESNIRVYVGAASVDTPARAMLQNLKQFNGKFGCGFCEMEGERVPRNNGSTRVFCEEGKDVQERTHARFLNQSSLATNQNPQQGVKGPSILMLAPKLDMAKSFVVEAMHAALLGTARQFTNLLLESRDDRYSLHKMVSTINSALAAIRPPKEIRRLPRSLDTIKFWKASEWRSFLLFYSPVIFQAVFKNKAYYNHWMLFANGMHMLMQKEVKRSSTKSAHLCFVKFAVKIPRLYGKEHVSSNVHLLTHLAETVVNWGPLWCTSAFAFEDANGRIKDLYHGTQAVPQQMVKNFLLLKQVGSESLKMESAPLACRSLFGTLTRTAVPLSNRNVRFGSGLVAVGQSWESLLSTHETYVLSEYLEDLHVRVPAVMYDKFVLNGTFYSSFNYCQKFSRDDSFIQIAGERSLTFGRIVKLVLARLKCNCTGNHVCELEAFIYYNMVCVDSSLKITDTFTNLDLHRFLKGVLNIETHRKRVCHISKVMSKCISVGNFIISLPKFELD